MNGEPFREGERIILLDGRGRRFLARLEAGGSFHHHGGAVPHDLILGSEEGTVVHSTTGKSLVCFRPRLVDFVLKMGRGAQVIYPKDLGPMLVYGDVFAGARVLEAGTGSGALTMALCRAVGPEGRVVSYEVREDFHRVATENVEQFFGKVPAWLDLRLGDLREVARTEDRFHRLFLDLPAPWEALPEVSGALVPGAIVCGYVPTTGQVQSLVQGLRETGFTEVETFEVLHRTWHVEPRSVRPDHRMVAHTGFVTVARRIAPPILGQG